MSAVSQMAVPGDESCQATAPFFMTASAPRSADIHLFASGDERHLFVANGSQLFDIEPGLFAELGAAISTGQVGGVLARVGLEGSRFIDDRPLTQPPIHALSLAIAQKMQSRLHVLLCATR
jgi:uncharacterized protein